MIRYLYRRYHPLGTVSAYRYSGWLDTIFNNIVNPRITRGGIIACSIVDIKPRMAGFIITLTGSIVRFTDINKLLVRNCIASQFRIIRIVRVGIGPCTGTEDEIVVTILLFARATDI